jgi:hypothetical protein
MMTLEKQSLFMKDNDPSEKVFISPRERRYGASGHTKDRLAF